MGCTTSKEQDLFAAIKNGDIATVQQLLDQGVDVNSTNDEGETSVILASACGNLYLVELLLAKGANVDIQCMHGYTALMWASDKGRQDIVKALVDKNAKLDTRDNNGMTALVWASNFGHLDCVQLLLEFGADITIKSHNGWSAKDWAKDMGHYEIIQYLTLQEEVCASSCKYAIKSTILILNTLSPYAHLNSFFSICFFHYLFSYKQLHVHPMINASKDGNLTEVQRLLNQGADVNTKDTDGLTPLIHASACGQ